MKRIMEAKGMYKKMTIQDSKKKKDKEKIFQAFHSLRFQYIRFVQAS